MKNLFDRLYKRYDAWYERYPYAYLSELKAVGKVLPRKGNGLEIGVGTGRFAAPLKIRTGIDVSKKMLDIARTRGIKVRQGRAEALPFPSAYFDYAALIFTLCFARDPEKTLAEAHRILKPKGVLVSGVIPKDSPLGRFYAGKNSVFYKHARFFKEKEILKLLRSAGFKGFRIHRTLSRLPGDMKKIESPKQGRQGSRSFTVIRCIKPLPERKILHEKENRV